MEFKFVLDQLVWIRARLVMVISDWAFICMHMCYDSHDKNCAIDDIRHLRNVFLAINYVILDLRLLSIFLIHVIGLLLRLSLISHVCRICVVSVYM